MIQEKTVANAIAVVTAAVYIICRLIAQMAPTLLTTIGQSWFHTINLQSAPVTSAMTTQMFIVGLVSSVVFAWVVTYAVARLYNRWA